MENYSILEKNLAHELFETHYDALLVIARARRRRHTNSDTFETIDVLHESFMKINKEQKWGSSKHFINAVALAIRHVIIDHARRKQTVKRGDDVKTVSYESNDALFPEFWETPEQIIEISDLMGKLKQENPRWMRVVDARYFCGFTEGEAAVILGVSNRTIRRDWSSARGWLAKSMELSVAAY